MARSKKAAETVDQIEMLRRLIGFDTTSHKSNLALIEAVAAYLDRHGVASHLVHDATGEKANLFATVGPERDGGIVLSGHTDVVPVEGQDWATDPFDATVKDDLLYGRGACDMKGFIAVALSLVPDMVAADLKTPIHFALSYDEEVGCIGVPHLLAKIASELPSPRLAIVGEPTDMALVNAHKGMATFKTTVTGLEAHSSAPQLGVSAITHAAEIVQFIDRLAREMAEHGPFHEGFTPPHTTFNIGRVTGGTAVNIIPRQCSVEWEFRLIPGDDIGEIRARVDRFVEDDLLPRMRERFPDAAVETVENASAPPLVPTPDSPAEALVRQLTGANQSGAVSFATEAGHFQTAGIDAVIIGPGSIEQAHKPNEFVALSQLDVCADFLKKVIAYAAETSPP